MLYSRIYEILDKSVCECSALHESNELIMRMKINRYDYLHEFIISYKPTSEYCGLAGSRTAFNGYCMGLAEEGFDVKTMKKRL